MQIDLKELAEFIVKAKKQAYAGDGREVEPQRPGFKELEYKEGNWEYRDSYSGFYLAPGQEVVKFQGRPIWAMSYCGGMRPRHHGDKTFAKQTFAFLKKVLLHVQVERPFRGPQFFEEGEYKYFDLSEGDIEDFAGREHIIYRGVEVFRQNYIGGLIVPKE